MPVQETLDQIRVVLESGFVNEGVQVTEFHKALSEMLGVERLVMMNSCTSALTMAYKLSGVGPDTEVITTAMTCVATNTPIDNLGAKIVWADINPDTASIDPADVEKKITPKTKAIVAVAWAGTPCHLDELSAISRRHNIPLIVDAAHAFGALWRGRPLSDVADFVCYSFQAIKHLSSGDGGALACRAEDKYLLARKLKWFGYDRDVHKDEKGEWKGQRWSADIEPGEIGFKFNMNNISAAIGLSQMPFIGGILEKHRRNAKVYQQAFGGSNLVRALSVPAEALSSFWVFTARLTAPSVDRDELLEYLNAEGIAAGLVHLPNDMYSAFKPYSADLPGVRLFSDTQISLPCGWWLEEADCRFIADRVLALAKA